MNFNNRVVVKGKVVYYINGQKFENSPNKRDGKDKAIQYCLDNFLNPSDIQKFDSRTECAYYEYLLEKQKIGLISNLGHHYTIKIQDEYINANGDTIPPITYEADFIYFDLQTNKRMIVDTKGSEYFIDERFITLKQVFDKLMKDKGLYLQVILYRNKEWVEWHIGDKKKEGKLIKKQSAEIKELRKQIHDREIADNKKEREIARLNELRNKETLSKQQTNRLNELEDKYKV